MIFNHDLNYEKLFIILNRLLSKNFEICLNLNHFHKNLNLLF